MKEIYPILNELFKEGRPSVLATIIKQAGPSPRGIGAKCVILDDGSLAGTIGGGLLEGQTVEAARRVFDTGLPLRLSFDLKGTDVAETNMLCGGEVEVFLEPVLPSNENMLSIFEKIMRIHRRGGAGVLATVIDQSGWKPGEIPKFYLEPGGESVGVSPSDPGIVKALGARIDQILQARHPVILSLTDLGGPPVEIYAEPIQSDPVLYIFGGGHVSRQIVPLASLVGFQVEVIDDRREFALAEDFPGARAVRCSSFDAVLDHLPIDESAYLVIVTRGHLSDKVVLEQALRTDARYIGMIGSRRKRDTLYQKLLEEGFSRNHLERVHSPIGLPIGGETPEEIAVSIVAELIKVRAGKD